MSSSHYFADAQVTHQVTTTAKGFNRQCLASIESFWETTIIGIPLITSRAQSRRQLS